MMANRHWTDNEIEEAYRYWAWESQDSIKATADFLGIPERTVYTWAERDGWRKRKQAEQADLAEPAVGQAQVMLKLGLSDAVVQLLADASNPKLLPQDRLNSQKLLFALTLGQQFDMGKGPSFISLTDARQIHMNGLANQGTDPNELRKIAARAIEANVNAVDSGPSKRHGPVKVS